MTGLHRAKAQLAAGQPHRAVESLTLGFLEAAFDGDFEQRLDLLCQAYRALELPRAETAIALFRGKIGEAEALSVGRLSDLARCARARRDPASAARLYERDGRLAHAAVQLEEAGDERAARLCWSALAADPRLEGTPYLRGLVHFVEGLCAAKLGDSAAARRASVESARWLDAAADGFESLGRRERAFDCYQALIALGRATGSYENLAEGYLNAIRIAKADALHYFALQLYEDFQQLSVGCGELYAAATLFDEAAALCQARGLPYERFHRQRAAETRAELAERGLAGFNQAEPDAERATTRAAEALLSVGAHARARGLYRRLARFSDTRRARFEALAARLEGVPDAPMDAAPLPTHLRVRDPYPEIWRSDLLEWERGGDAAETMAELLASDTYPAHTRHRALLCRLEALRAAALPEREELSAQLAAHLARVGVFDALAPLERLLRHDSARVREAAARAAGELPFKRSFELIGRALDDPNGRVRDAAVAALGGLSFGHALDPLRHLYGRHSAPNIKRGLLEAIARIPRQEASETLLEVFRGGDADERALAHRALLRSADPALDALLARDIAASSGAHRRLLEELRSRRA